MNFYKLTEKSYINNAVQEAGAVVRINDDPKNGGMTPGANLEPCNEDGSPREAGKVEAEAKPVKTGKASKVVESGDDIG